MKRILWTSLLVCLSLAGCGYANFQGAISIASHQANLRTVGAFSPDGRRFAVIESRLAPGRGETAVLRIYRRGPTPDLPAQWRLGTRVKLGDLFAVDAVFSPDGQTLALAGLAPTHNVVLWDAKAGRIRRVLAGNAPLTQALAFSPDGGALITAGLDGTIRVFGVMDGALRAIVREDPALLRQERFPLVVDHEGRWIAYGRADGRVALADLHTGAPRGTLDTGARALFDLARSSDGRWLAAASDVGLLLWDLRRTGAAPRLLAEVRAPALAFSPDSQSLLFPTASGGHGRVVSVPDGRVVYGYRQPPRAESAPSGRAASAWSRLQESFPQGPASSSLQALVRAYVRSTRVHRVAFSPENLWIAIFEGRHAGLVITKRHYELRRVATPSPKATPPPPPSLPAAAPTGRVEGSI